MLEAFIEGNSSLPFDIRLALALPIAERIMLASRRHVVARGVGLKHVCSCHGMFSSSLLDLSLLLPLRRVTCTYTIHKRNAEILLQPTLLYAHMGARV